MTKDLKYILKRVAIGVLIFLIITFIKSCNVKALTNGGVVNGLTIPASSSEARFFSLNSNGNVTEKGYSFLTNGDILYAIPSTPNYNYGTGGGAISLCNLSLVNNYFYGVTYYFASAVSSDFVHPYYTSFTNKLGIYSVPTGGSFDFTYVSVSNGVQKGTYSGLTPVGDTIYSYTVIFKANKTDTCLYSAFSSSSKNLSATELAFLGYTIENLGSQALTEQQITNIINNANSQVINNIQNSSSSIINNQNQNTQQIISSQQDTTDAINDLNDTIKDGSIPSDTDSKINNITSAITANQNSNIVQIATFIPQTLQQILNGFNNSCSGGYSLGTLYGTELILPCINPVDYLGSFLWGVIDSILCLCYLIPLCKFLVNKYNDLTSLKNMRWE